MKLKKSEIENIIEEEIDGLLSEFVLVEDEDLYEAVQDAVCEEGSSPCPQCLYEVMHEASCGCPDLIPEAEYKGKKVTLNKRLPGDVKKSKVYVKGCGKDKNRVKKINFGDKKMKIKKSNVENLSEPATNAQPQKISVQLDIGLVKLGSLCYSVYTL